MWIYSESPWMYSPLKNGFQYPNLGVSNTDNILTNSNFQLCIYWNAEERLGKITLVHIVEFLGSKYCSFQLQNLKQCFKTFYEFLYTIDFLLYEAKVSSCCLFYDFVKFPGHLRMFSLPFLFGILKYHQLVQAHNQDDLKCFELL